MAICRTCGKQIKRRVVNIRMENERTFLSRVFCNYVCEASFKESENPLTRVCARCGSKLKMVNRLCQLCEVRLKFSQFLRRQKV